MVNFARNFGLKIPRIRVSRGPSSLPSREQDSLSGDVAPGNVEERMRRRDIYNQFGRKGARAFLQNEMALAKEARQGGKDAFSQMMQVEKEKSEREKFFVGKWLDLVIKARESGDEAMYKHLLNSGRDYIDTLSPGAQALVEPMLRTGPFSKQAAMIQKYDELHPAPRVTADPEKEQLLYAQQLWDREDWNAARTHFGTGKTAPKRSIIPMADGLYTMRDDKGRASVVNEAVLQVKEFAKQHNTTEGQVLAQGGAYTKEISTYINGKPSKQRIFVGLDGKTHLEDVPSMTTEQYNKKEKDVAEFLSVLVSGDEKLMAKHPLAKMVTELDGMDSDDGWAQAQPLLKQAYGYNFIRPRKDAKWYDEVMDFFQPGNRVKGSSALFTGGYVEGDLDKIRVVPGDEEIFQVNNDFRTVVYYDKGGDQIFTLDGRSLGDPNTARRRIQSELDKKKREEEYKKIEKESESKKKSGLGIGLMTNLFKRSEWE